MLARRVTKRMFSRVFLGEDILERIRVFSQNRQEVREVGMFTYPSYLKQVNAKQLDSYIKTHNIPTNLAILHALAHIQFNAFSSYVDTYYRFAQIPNEDIPKERISEFSQDTARVALQQGKHFQALFHRLTSLNNPYGSLPVITGLTKNIEQTSNSCLQRVMVISLVQEGKGLDAALRLHHKVASVGDKDSLPILEMIAKQEACHVGYGVKWFKIMCQHRKMNPKEAFKKILEERSLRIGNVDKRQRERAGFPLQWLD